jgi:hypothetical protein
LSGQGPLNASIVETVFRHAVGLDDRPVGEILEQDLGRIDDAMFLLCAGPAAKRHLSPIDDPVATDVVVGLDDNHRGAVIGGANRGWEAAGTGAEHDDIGLEVPPAGDR